ncbi:LOW QUALITY PROTEIN: membrane protein [Geomicrobium sp. JCM 19039]|nr:LOW QUALITY PROTEIN: membrane protein [Geomicrobium sp. JCM 19039]
MDYFLSVFLDVIFPILLLMVIGILMQKKFQFNIRALANLLTYCFMPAAVFLNLAQTELDVQLLGQVLLFLIIYTALMMIVTGLLGKSLQLDQKQSAILKNSIGLMNSGNYGLPISQMLFQANPILSVQIIVLIFQNILTYTYGLYNLISATKSGLEIVIAMLRLPVIHAMILGIIFNAWSIPIPTPLLTPIQYLADGFMAVALILLGAQIALIKMSKLNRVIIWGTIGRLLVGPAVALAVIWTLQIDGIIAQSLLIASALPTSRNSATLALEHDVLQETAGQIVLFTTLLSAISVTFFIYLSTVLF